MLSYSNAVAGGKQSVKVGSNKSKPSSSSSQKNSSPVDNKKDVPVKTAAVTVVLKNTSNSSGANNDTHHPIAENITVEKIDTRSNSAHCAENRKLFVGMLGANTTEDDLKILFSPYGTIVECIVLRQNGISRKCAFVKYGSADEANEAAKELNGSKIIKGASAPIVVKPADPERERANAAPADQVAGGPNILSGGGVATVSLNAANSYGDAPFVITSPNQGGAGIPNTTSNAAEQRSQPPGPVTPNTAALFNNIYNPYQAMNSFPSLMQQSAMMMDPFSYAYAAATQHLQFPNQFGSLPPTSALSPPKTLNIGGTMTPQDFQSPDYQLANDKLAATVAQVAAQYGAMNNYNAIMAAAMAYLSALQMSAAAPAVTPGGGGSATTDQACTPPTRAGSSPPFGSDGGTKAAAAAAAAAAKHERQLRGPPGANLFIYHLPPEVGDKQLEEMFLPFGSIVSRKVYLDDEGVSKCFGFVSYESKESAQHAISCMHGFRMGRKILKVEHKKDRFIKH